MVHFVYVTSLVPLPTCLAVCLSAFRNTDGADLRYGTSHHHDNESIETTTALIDQLRRLLQCGLRTSTLFQLDPKPCLFSPRCHAPIREATQRRPLFYASTGGFVSRRRRRLVSNQYDHTPWQGSGFALRNNIQRGGEKCE